MDFKKHTFVFPDFTLQRGASVCVWTKSGKDTVIDLYWGRKAAVWNKRGDTAYLSDRLGLPVSTYKY